MLPPLLEIYVVWHPADHDGQAVADELIDHFHGTAFSGLIGGAIEVFVRSEGWSGDDDAPRALPYVSPLPSGILEAELTVVVPVIGRRLARAVERPGPWQDYAGRMRAQADARPSNVRLLPIRLPSGPAEGVLHSILGDLQSIASGPAAPRDLAQAIAQFAGRDTERLTVFLSHTKRAGEQGGDAPLKLVERVRHAILETRLADFFDAQDLQPGCDWASHLEAEAATSALLAIRTDLYATRRWCQTEVLTAKRAGMPVVMLDALAYGEDRGSFLMDHVPRIPLRGIDDDAAIMRALEQLVDECLKRALWRRQEDLAVRQGVDVADWWAPHAPSRSRSSVGCRTGRAAFRPATPSSFCIRIRRWVATNSMPCARSPLCAASATVSRS